MAESWPTSGLRLAKYINQTHERDRRPVSLFSSGLKMKFVSFCLSHFLLDCRFRTANDNHYLFIEDWLRNEADTRVTSSVPVGFGAASLRCLDLAGLLTWIQLNRVVSSIIMSEFSCWCLIQPFDWFDFALWMRLSHREQHHLMIYLFRWGDYITRLSLDGQPHKAGPLRAQLGEFDMLWEASAGFSKTLPI